MSKNFIKSTAFLAIIACILWSSAFTAIKIGLQYTPPLQFAGIRFLLAGLILLPFIKQFPLKLRIAANYWKQIGLVGFLQITVEYAFFYSGMNLVQGALGAMIVGSGPLFVALVTHIILKNDKITLRKGISIALGLAGVVILTLSQKELTVEGSLVGVGIVLLILNNITSGVGNVFAAKTTKGLPPLILSSFSMIIGGGALFILAVPAEGFNKQTLPLEYFISLGWLSFLSAAAITIWYTLLRRPEVKVSDLNMWKFIIPVLGAILSWTMLPNESPDWMSVLGMGVIASSLLFLSSKRIKI